MNAGIYFKETMGWFFLVIPTHSLLSTSKMRCSWELDYFRFKGNSNSFPAEHQQDEMQLGVGLFPFQRDPNGWFPLVP